MTALFPVGLQLGLVSASECISAPVLALAAYAIIRFDKLLRTRELA